MFHLELLIEHFIDDVIIHESSDYPCYDSTPDDPCYDSSPDDPYDEPNTIFLPLCEPSIHSFLQAYFPESSDHPCYDISNDDLFEDDLDSHTHSVDQSDYTCEDVCVEAGLYFF